MIKFFRRIRQQLLIDNRFTKYLLYAIGEIILVVIGILIALQVNNANENRKQRNLELKILKTIEEDLSKDIMSLSSMIRFEEQIIGNNKSLMEILADNQAEYDHTMDTLFGSINRYGVFYPQQIGYESLKSIGLEVLRSDTLKAALVHCYDVDYGIIEETLELKKQIYLNTNPIFLSELATVGEDEGQMTVVNKRPNNFERLQKNEIFYNHLSHIYAERLNFIAFARQVLKSTMKLNEDLRTEIKCMTHD